MAAPGASLSPAPAGRTEPRSRAHELRKRFAGSPWPGRLSRWLSLIAGALLITGALRPWVYIPVGGLRVPIFGLLSLGGLALVGGLFLLLHSRPGPGPLLVVGVAAWYLASTVPPQLLASARGTTGIVDSWIDPLNQLLSRFHIQELHLVDWTLPAAHAVGPGVSLTRWGAGLSLLAAVTAALALRPAAAAPANCPSCRTRTDRRRSLRFCPACGFTLGGEPVCGRCGSVGEPGDRFCVRCGERLSGEQPRR